MKNFLNIKDLSTKELRKILTDAKKRKKKEKILTLWIQIKTCL